MSNKAQTTLERETELQIDTSRMSEGKRQALEVAEAARETTCRVVGNTTIIGPAAIPPSTNKKAR